jgi:hypothetical protein
VFVAGVVLVVVGLPLALADVARRVIIGRREHDMVGAIWGGGAGWPVWAALGFLIFFVGGALIAGRAVSDGHRNDRRF